MKFTCEKCGEEWERRWMKAGLCFDCAYDPDVILQPATTLAGVTERECTFCGRDIDHGELCPKCDNSLSNLDALR